MEIILKRFKIALLFNFGYRNCLEVHSKTTFLTSCRRHLVLCASSLLSLWLSMATERNSGFQTGRTATHDAPWSFFFLLAHCFVLFVVLNGKQNGQNRKWSVWRDGRNCHVMKRVTNPENDSISTDNSTGDAK